MGFRCRVGWGSGQGHGPDLRSGPRVVVQYVSVTSIFVVERLSLTALWLAKRDINTLSICVSPFTPTIQRSVALQSFGLPVVTDF